MLAAKEKTEPLGASVPQAETRVRGLPPGRENGIGGRCPVTSTNVSGCGQAYAGTASDGLVNRYYSNAYGRFMTPDPYQGNSGGPGDPNNPQSWNHYAYTTGDPVNYNDPTGMAETEIDYGTSWPVDASYSPSLGLPTLPGPQLVDPNNWWYQQVDRETAIVDSSLILTGATGWNFVNGNISQIGMSFVGPGAVIAAAACAADPVCAAGAIVVGGVITIYVAYQYLPGLISAIENADKPTTIQVDDCLLQYNKDRNKCVQGPPGDLVHCLQVAELNYHRCKQGQAPLPLPGQ